MSEHDDQSREPHEGESITIRQGGTQYWTDFRRVTWKDSFAQPRDRDRDHATRSLSGNPSSRSRAIGCESVPSFFAMMQVF